MYTSLPRGVARCQHIKINGTRCDSPALKGKAYCYFHYRSRLREPVPSPLSPTPNGQQPTAAVADGRQPKAEGPHPLSPPPDLFLLEDANSIQCALQWVLRRILDASIDHRQASLLLYGLQIAAANIKLTHFRPSYSDVIRSLPAEKEAPSTCTLPADPSSETAHPSPQNSPDCHPDLGRDELHTDHLRLTTVPLATDNRQLATVTDHCPLTTDPSSSPPANPQPSTTPAEGREPTAESPNASLTTDHRPPTTAPLATDNSQLATLTDHRPLTTASKRTSRRPKPLATDNWQLATVNCKARPFPDVPA